MNIREDPILKRMFIRKNLSESRRRMYTYNFTELYELTGLTPSELIAEAKDEQRPSLDKNSQIIFKDVEDRKVTEYLYKYYENMVEKKLKPSTMKTKMGVVRSFYKNCNIELPENINITIPRQLIREGDIPCLDDIKKGVEQAKYLKYKAIILLAATSGIRSGDLRHLTVGDFLEATKEYHNGTLEDLLHSKKDIIPTWDFIPRKTMKTGNICITFNTPEASRYIIDYLKQRIQRGHKLTDDSFLFVSGKEKQYSIKGFLWVFSSVNNELFGKDKLNRDFFRAHNLRKFFLSTFRQKTNDLFTLKVVAGHTLAKNNDMNYQEIPIKEIKRQYMKVIPFLSIKDTRVHTIKSKEFKQLEKLMKEKEKEMQNEIEKMQTELKKQQFLSAQLESLLERERFNQQDEEVKKEILKGDFKVLKKDEIKAKKS
ncbi:tyrosine-type recombinase/integrase [Methanobacterium oryzae]|uniref:tyrosine-type recombinase/integrase n=1 Tax=Methanobacterium oryzae TaxID=69540 RepID=UPI003D1F6610